MQYGSEARASMVLAYAALSLMALMEGHWGAAAMYGLLGHLHARSP